MERLLQRLLAIPGVVSAQIVNRDGLTLASALEEDRAGAERAAPTAVAFDALTALARVVAGAAPRITLIEAGATIVALAEAGDVIVLVEAGPPAPLGRVRLETLRVAADVLAHRRG